MFILADTKTGGIYAVKNKDYKNTVTVFEDEDDAIRYISMLNAEDYEDELETLEVDIDAIIVNCNTYGYGYSIVQKDDLIIPP